jgi:eukaryotic-like serine/threonine-protein kinase
MIGTYLNQRYRLDEEIGRGGLGIIYHAYDTLLDRSVAVKILNSGTGLGSQGQARLLNEARSAARLNHPNIVSIYDAGKTESGLQTGGDVSFIVMELVEGKSLHEQKPQSIEEILDIARQICTALQNAHDNGIIHRDLKPENVLITPEGIAKLTDFGLARSHASRLSQENMIIGTVYYLAPEMALGQPVDGRTDLYALGVMLYEMITGVLPFTADDPLAVISQHLHAPVVPPSTYNQAVSQLLDAFILSLLAKNPDDRIPSARDAAQMIVQISTGNHHADLPELSPLERLARGRLIGRENQIAEIRELWKRLQASQLNQPLLLISGESGVGKTPLLRELSSMTELSGARVYKGQCYAEGNAPYAPIGQILRQALPEAEGLLTEAVKISLHNLVPEMALQPVPTVSQPVDPLSEQQRSFESVMLLCQALATNRPVVFQLEDVHWADGGTLAMVRYLARRLRTMRPSPRVWIVMTYRDSDLEATCCLEDFLLDFNMEHLANYIRLERLTRSQTQELLKTMFMEEVSQHFVDVIHKVTEGNYFFIEEMCKTLIEEGVIVREKGRWVLKQDLQDIHLPQSVHVTIQARVSKLDQNLQEILRLAAVIGREFDFEVLEKASGLDEESLVKALEIAERAQLIQIVPQKGRLNSPVEMFEFAHGLIPLSLREEISALRRRRLHKRVFSAIEALHPDDFESLAYHAGEAGDEDLARQYTFRAGERALTVYSNREAARYFRNALGMNLPEEQQVRAETGLAEALFRQGNFEEAAELWENAADNYLQGHDHDSSARYAARAARARWHNGDMPQSVEICEGYMNRIRQMVANMAELDTPGMATLLHELARAYRFNNQPEEALPLCRQALDLAETLELVDVQADALATLGILPNISREEARQVTIKAVDLAEAHGLYTIAYRAHNNLSQLLIDSGELSAARAHSVRCRELAQKIGLIDWEIHQLVGVTTISAMMGDMAAVNHNLEVIRTLTPQVTLPKYAGKDVKSVEARIAFISGQFDKANQLYTDLIENEPEKAEPEYRLHFLTQLAEVAIELEQPDKAQMYLDEGKNVHITEPFMDKIASLILSAEVHLLRGELPDARHLLETAQEKVGSDPSFNEKFEINWVLSRLLAAEGDFDQAERLFSELDAMTQKAEAVWLRARVLCDWANMLVRRLKSNDLASAVAKLEEARQIFLKMGSEGYVKRIQKRLDGLESLAPTQ